MNAPRDTYVTLLDDHCIYEKLARPVYIRLLDIPTTLSSLVGVKVCAGHYSTDAFAASMSEACEGAAEQIYENLQMLPSIHSIPGILRHAASRVPPGMDSAWYIHKLKNKSMLRRQKYRIENASEVYENHRGLMDLFEEHKRITAMEALNGYDNSELLIARAANTLGLKIRWKFKPYRTTTLPLVSLKLKNTLPELKFVGYDRNDAATNCAHYLKLTLLEQKKIPDLFKF